MGVVNLTEYNSPADLFQIVEESMINDMEMLSLMIENSIVATSLEEAEGNKTKATNKRYDALVKIFENLKINFMKGLDKIKALCANLKAKMRKFKDNRIAKYVEKYEAKFQANKKAAVGDRFKIKYNKKLIEFTEKDLAKAIDDSIVAGKMIAKNTVSLARKHTEAINKNRNNIFKVEGLNKYADKFCCCCKEKPEMVKGNPFNGGFTPDKLLKELKHGSLDVNMDKLVNAMEQSFESIRNQADDVIKSAKQNPDKVSAEDLAVATAANAICSGTIKAYAHSLSDIIKGEKAHLAECIKIFGAVANMRVVTESEYIEYGCDDAIMLEADLLVEDLEFALEANAEGFKDFIEKKMQDKAKSGNVINIDDFEKEAKEAEDKKEDK